MRVALVYRNFNMSGSLERDAVLAARALTEHGIDVHIYSNPDAHDAKIDGAVFHDVRPLTRSRSRFGYPTETGSFAAAATRAVRRDRAHYDVVDVRGTAGWEHDVVTVHGVTRAQQGRWLESAGPAYRAAAVRSRLAPVLRPHIGVARSIERLQFRRGRYVVAVAVTDAVADDLARVHRIPRDRIAVVPLPIDLEAYIANGTETDVRASLGIDDSSTLLLFVGNEFERKGLADAVRSLRSAPHAHLVVVGRDSPERYLRQAGELGVADRVHFTGGTSSPERYFQAADVFLLPTKEDPWGLTLVEAMAAGLPSVTTKAAGAAAVVDAAGAGVVVSSGEGEEFEAAVARLAANPGERRALGERGREQGRLFGPDAHADRLIAVYERVVRERELRRG
jgi:UDP-glucose:(heptosyl)LPS alpha-1,3-glucosyltransferase